MGAVVAARDPDLSGVSLVVIAFHPNFLPAARRGVPSQSYTINSADGARWRES